MRGGGRVREDVSKKFKVLYPKRPQTQKTNGTYLGKEGT